MKVNRSFLFRAGTIAILLCIAAVMFVIGRGHTVYFDNKTIEVNGQEYSAQQRVVVFVKGEQVAKLAKRERGMATWIGQNFKMTLEVTPNKGDDPKTIEVSMKLPYNLDGIVVNLPAYLAGLPESDYMSEFVPLVTNEPQEEEVITDEFDITSDF